MPKSNYGKIKKYENEILSMKEAGYTKRRIAEELKVVSRVMRKIDIGIW